MTVSFLALSVSDLCYLILLSPHLAFNSAQHIFQFRMGMTIEWVLDPIILVFPFYCYSFTFYETSTLITVYISVVRCAWVAMPFKVKTTFTARRAIAAFIVFFVSIVLLRVPTFIKKIDPVTNSSRVVYDEVDDGNLADRINDIANRNILTWTSLISVISCLVVMVVKLQASARLIWRYR